MWLSFGGASIGSSFRYEDMEFVLLPLKVINHT